MRLATLVADIHLGNHHATTPIGGPMRSGLNDRCREIAEVLAITGQKSSGPLLVAGDLFDTHDPSPEIVARAMGALRDRAYVLVGNHDQSSWDRLHHALAPLCRQSTVWERPSVVQLRPAVHVIAVPFRNIPGPQHLRESLESLDLPESRRSLLLMHMGIEDAKTPPWLQGSRNSIGLAELVKILDEFGIHDCAAGDWHEHRLWSLGGHNITQIGALCPTGWDNPGTEGYGSLIHWHDDGTLEREEIPGPRFVEGDSEEAPEGYRYYRRYKIKDAQEAQRYRDKEHSVVQFDRKASAEANEKAAASVRNVAQLGEKLRDYCADLFGSRAGSVNEAVLDCIAEAKKQS